MSDSPGSSGGSGEPWKPWVTPERPGEPWAKRGPSKLEDIHICPHGGLTVNLSLEQGKHNIYDYHRIMISICHGAYRPYVSMSHVEYQGKVGTPEIQRALGRQSGRVDSAKAGGVNLGFRVRV